MITKLFLLIALPAFQLCCATELTQKDSDYIEYSTLIVSREKLPENKNERRYFLDDYFCETLASAEEETEGWKISLQKPNCVDFFIDPNISDNSKMWGGISNLYEISYFYRNIGNVFESFNDNWTLLSWAKQWEEYNKANPLLPHQTLTILHLDDHEDLMSPRICISGDQMFDMITKKEIRLNDFEGLESSLISGAIGIGSFIPPFLFTLKDINIQLRHLSERYVGKSSHIQRIHVETIDDHFLLGGKGRLSLNRESITTFEESDSKHCYYVTSCMDEFLLNIPEGPIFLHFDMDYFNDRFDGSSDWEARGRCHNPNLTNVMERINLFLCKLANLNIKDKIINVTVAVSPGFFPSEMWNESTQRIRDFFNS